jgi:hypothetical protein
MHRLNLGVVLAQCKGLGISQGFLKFGGEFVNTHLRISNAHLAWAGGPIFKAHKASLFA